MWFVLFKTLEGIPYYGDEPDVPEPLPDPRVEKYDFDFSTNLEIWHQFKNDFVNPVNDSCGSLLDFGDCDYFDFEKCIKLKDWLEKRLAVDVPDTFKPAYENLLDYASQAIVLKTGVIVQV